MSLYAYEKNFVVVGPWGGQYGSKWDDGVYSSVRQIVVTHGDGIDCIQVEYDKQGRAVWSGKHGGTGGYKTDRVNLEYPGEYLTAIHGYYGPLYSGGPVCIRSLSFDSNEKSFGPFGVEEGTSFTFPMMDGKVVGLYGTAGWYLDSIGAYVKPICDSSSPMKTLVSSQNNISTGTGKLGYSVVQGRMGTGTEKFGYSVVQGSIGNNYDIVVAVKQKENLNYNNSSPAAFPRPNSSSSSDSSDVEDKHKIWARPPSNEEKYHLVGGPVRYGPWGGDGGSVFDDGNVYSGVKQIKLSRNVGIVWIQVLYDQNGKDIWGRSNGGTGGFIYDKIVFDYPYEILTHITGCYSPPMVYGPTIIRSITFHTTKGKYGPYGEEKGQSFSTNLKEGTIVGFHGRKGLFIDAIGVHVKEGKVTPLVRSTNPHDDAGDLSIHPHNNAGAFSIHPHNKAGALSTHPHNNAGAFSIHPHNKAGALSTHPHTNAGAHTTQGDNQLTRISKPVGNRLQFEEGTRDVVKEPAPCGPGPWGGDGGKPWDDGVYTGIKQIFVRRSEVIYSIQIEYDRNGQSVWSVKHGGDSGSYVHRVKLDYPNEVLTCISGYYGPLGIGHSHQVIKSLTFHTTRGKFGPFGEEVGTYFTSMKAEEGKVVGLHGRSGLYLDAIGVHMQHWLGSRGKQQKPTSFFKMFG